MRSKIPEHIKTLRKIKENIYFLLISRKSEMAMLIEIKFGDY